MMSIIITWQAFEPPVDLSQDLDDGCEDTNLDCAPHEKYILDERHDSSCQPALTNNCRHKEESKRIHDSVRRTLSIAVRSRQSETISLSFMFFNLIV